MVCVLIAIPRPDSPKSVSLIWPLLPISRLLGLRSRCTMPLEWQYSKASTVSETYYLATSSCTDPITSSRLYTSPPLKYSITRNRLASDWKQ